MQETTAAILLELLQAVSAAGISYKHQISHLFKRVELPLKIQIGMVISDTRTRIQVVIPSQALNPTSINNKFTLGKLETHIKTHMKVE